MKKIILNVCILCIAVVLVIISCKKNDQTITYNSGTAPVLTAVSGSGSSAIVLTKANATATALSLYWTNPNYQLSTGTNTLDVTYYIEVDTLANFSTKVQISSVSKDLTTSFTQKALNTALLQAGYLANTTYKLYVRVTSTIGGTSSETNISSNVLQYTVTTYLDVAVDLPTGDLWMVGTLNGWTNSTSLDTKYKFTKKSATTYSLTVDIPASAQYLLIGTLGDWGDGSKYGCVCGSDGCNDPKAYSFKHGGNNIAGPTSAGTYTISVDFVKGTITVTP